MSDPLLPFLTSLEQDLALAGCFSKDTRATHHSCAQLASVGKQEQLLQADSCHLTETEQVRSNGITQSYAKGRTDMFSLLAVLDVTTPCRFLAKADLNTKWLRDSPACVNLAKTVPTQRNPNVKLLRQSSSHWHVMTPHPTEHSGEGV